MESEHLKERITSILGGGLIKLANND